MGNRNKARPTLKDLAEITGYSINTISRALRNMPDISERTASRIQALARDMGYYGNALASSLRLGFSKTVAIIVPEISNLFYTLAIEEIEKHLSGYGYSTILISTSEDGAHEEAAIRNAIEKNVDGIIFSPAQNHTKTLQMLMDYDIPFVLLARTFDGANLDYVVADDKMGGFQATTYLLEQNHKNILFLNSSSHHNSSAYYRKEGYILAHKEAGLPVQPDLIREVSSMGRNSGSELEEAFKRRSDISAIFAYSDMVAWSAIEWCNRNGLRVPHDISVMGFDNLHAHINIPIPLTSVDIHISQMAIATADALIQKLQSENKNEVLTQKVIPTELAIGETVLPFKG